MSSTGDAPLVERLGFAADARLLIVTADGLGACHSANVGVYDTLRQGLATSASLQVPCPWAREAAARYRGEDVGVELTLNATHDYYRWGPITHAPSLLDGDGGFPRTVQDVWDHADLDEVRRECRAQVERAILWGFDVTHLVAYLDVLTYRPEFFDVLLDLGCEFRLPLRAVAQTDEPRLGFPLRKLAADQGVVMTDTTLAGHGGVSGRDRLERALAELGPGVTDIHFRPASDLPELRAFSEQWSEQVDDLELLTIDSHVGALVARSGVQLVGYRLLRDLMRATGS